MSKVRPAAATFARSIAAAMPYRGRANLLVRFPNNHLNQTNQIENQMKINTFVSMTLALVLAAVSAVAQSAKVDPKLEAEFAKLYEAWDQAQIKVDLKFLSQIYADEIQSIGPDGKIGTKEEMLADLKTGKDVIHSAKTDELKVAKHGETVVVTSRWTAKLTSNGKDASGQSRWTDVWVKRSGRWQIVNSHGSETSDTEAEAIQKITQLNKEWDEAYSKSDVAKLDRILAADFLTTAPDGTVDSKAGLIGGIKSGESSVQSALSDELKISVFGNTAVVTGRWTAKGKDKGKEWGGAHRFTDTWVRRDGRWQVVADHWSKIEKK